MTYPSSVSYNAALLYPMLREDDELAAGYLSECLQESRGVFLIALKDVRAARDITVSELARKTGLNRSSLYRVLSGKGNPEFSTLIQIIATLGFTVGILTKPDTKPPQAQAS